MSRAAFSVRVFAIYICLFGAALVTVPNLVLYVFRIPETHEAWLRVAGMLLMIISYYYYRASGAEMREFLRWTAHGRLSVGVFFAAFVLLGLAPPIIILIAVVDAAAAVWTLNSLAKDAAAAN